MKRINQLDGLRFLCITMVAFFHYTLPEYNAVVYPDAPDSVRPYFVRFGYLGVPIFFIISGFVIFFTLTKTRNMGEFMVKRMVRLFPPILICSIITFLLVPLLDPQVKFPRFHSQPLDFIPSLSFTDPIIWMKVFGRHDIKWISGSYWSLIIEVKFYILAGILYFINPAKFFTRWLWFVGCAYAVHVLVYLPWFESFSGTGELKRLVQLVFFTNSLIYFTVGLFFYYLYDKNKIEAWQAVLIGGIYLAASYVLHTWLGLLILSAMVLFFFLMIYRPRTLRVFETKLIARIGLISYTLYLLHENLGVVLIYRIREALDIHTFNPVIPVVVYTVFIVFCELMYRWYEVPARNLLLGMFFGKKQSKPVPTPETAGALNQTA